MAALKRRLGFWEVFCVAAGAMISSGLFVLPGQAFKIAGPAVVLAYALASVMVVPALLAKAELATAMPRSGGDYFFIERSMGALPGLLAGLASWLSIALKSAFAMVGIGAFAQLIWPQHGPAGPYWAWLIKGVAIGGCLVLAALNVLSVKLTGRLQVAMVAALLVVLVVFVAGGSGHVRQHPNFDNLLARGFVPVLATAAMVFVSYGGLTKVVSIAEEVRHPRRNLPGAMFLAFGVVSILYVAAVLVTVGVVDAGVLGGGAYGSLTPLSTAAGRFAGRWGLVALSAAAILAFVTTGNSGILAASRSPMAMARDGLLPAGLGATSRRFGTPYVSIVLTVAFMIVVIAGLSIPALVKAASTMKLILFALTNVAVLVMRGSRLQNYRPTYRMPLYPWLPAAGALLYVGLIVVLTALLGPVPLITAGAFLLLAVPWYLAYVRPRNRRESALVYMVRRAVAKEMFRGKLEEELREIALQRDEITSDRFDHMVQRCELLDLPQRTDAEALFARAAEVLAPRLETTPAALREKLAQREATSSTVIQPGLAIPHVIVGGRGRFDILPVRCRAGIVFDPARPPVQTAFILAGSADERNYHLQALMAIAQIVQEPGFTDRWLAATGPEALRDLLLLSPRQRQA
jgi:amino acid transporter/mannitol/fructose-specific phosphotransferase system IIA component (Ntr-type)